MKTSGVMHVPSVGPTDQELVSDFVTRRSDAAFTAIVSRYGAMVHAVCRRVLGDVTGADDASQATFLLLARHATRLKDRCVAGWLHEAAWRVACQALRTIRRRVRYERRSSPLSSNQSTPEALATAREVGRVLDEEIRRLPRLYRGVVTVCLLQGHSKADASRLLGWPEGTVAGRLSRAKVLLRRRLERRGFAPAIAVAGLSLPAAQAQPTCLQTLLSSAAVPAAVQRLVHDVRWMMFPKKYLSMTLLLMAFVCTGLLATQLLATEDHPSSSTRAEAPTQNAPAHPWEGLWLRLSQTLGGPEPSPAQVADRPGWLLVADGVVQDLPNPRRSFIPPGELKLDPEGKQTFDIHHTPKGGGAKVIYRGRYQRLDDLLILCMCTTADGVRPASFTTVGRLDVCLWTLQRAGEPAVAKRPDVFTQMDHYQITAAHLREIGQAFRNFHTDFGRLPRPKEWMTSTSADKHHDQSWRVNLLPYLGHDGLYKQYLHHEPWDSEANNRFLSHMPVVFSHPGSNAHREFKTHFRVFACSNKVPTDRPIRFAPPFRLEDTFAPQRNVAVPPGGAGGGATVAAGPPDPRLKIKDTDITDGLVNTLLVVEAAETVPWTQPEALVLDDDRSPLPKFGANPNVKSFAVVFADGKVYRFHRDLPNPAEFERLFRACIGYKDGVPVDWAALGVRK